MKKTFRHNDFTAVFSDEGTGSDNRYFSLTGDMGGGSGACGDKIVKAYPAFQILNDLHLAALDGTPMHALENAFYHFKESGWKIETLEGYWKVKLTDKQKEKIFSKGVNALGGETTEPLKHNVAMIMEEIRPQWADKVKAAYALVASTPSDLTDIDETISIDDFDNPTKVRALAAYLDVHFSTITEDGNDYTAQGITYQVLTDSEANDAWDEELENYLDEVVLPELPENARQYFDRERWKEDAQDDGRGHALGRYDGEEIDLQDPETEEYFYAYRE